MLSRGGLSKVPKSSLDYTSQFGDCASVLNVLRGWEEEGIIALIKDPRVADDVDVCVVFKSIFDGSEFPDHWIRD